MNAKYEVFAVGNGLDDIASYLELLHGFIESQKKDLDEIAEQIADGELDDFGDPVQPYVPGRWEMKKFSRILCGSAVAAICTYAEVELLSLAREDFMRRQKVKFPIRSERREACKSQLKKAENVEEYWKANQLDYARSIAWCEFKRLKQIRNRLAHSNGYLEDDKKSGEIRKYVKSREKLGLTGLSIEHNLLEVTPSYCDEARRIIQAMLSEVSNGIP